MGWFGKSHVAAEMKLRAKFTIGLMVAIAIGPLAMSAPAVGDVYIEVKNKADNYEHTYCWGGSFGSSAWRSAAEYAMSNLDAQTSYFRQFMSSCGTTTDVLWEVDPNMGDRGIWICRSWNDEAGQTGPGECESAVLRLNSALNTTTANQRHVACHELGHSVGFSHLVTTDCMKSGSVTSGYDTYDTDHVGHANKSNRNPWGYFDSAQRVSGGIRESAWDPRRLLTLETRMEHGNHRWAA